MCVTCGMEKASELFRRRGYGARSCMACDRAARKRRPYSAEYYELRRCIGCGSDFQFLRAAVNSGTHKGLYCSRKCRAERVAIACKTCKRSFSVWPCKAAERKYCSQFCAGTRLRPSQITDDVLRRTHYLSKEWRQRSSEIIERDGRECRQCGSGADLVVHHIVPWLESRDDSPENLVTLCRACHADRHRTPSGRLAGGASSRSAA